MQDKTTRTITSGRAVSLALIAALALGLGYLRFGSGADSIAVPEGAKAGDLVLKRCDYATEDGAYAADCGTLVVPENRADPNSRLIALPVKRIRARSADPAEPIFRLEGGPGRTNMKFAAASRFANDHDVVLVGYRGVDGSSVLDCPEVESALRHSTDLLGEKSTRAYGDAFTACAHRLTDEGVDLRGYTPTQRVDDLEAARAALGYDRIDLLSESAGTRWAMIYGWRYPNRVHRSVMIGVNPPGRFLWDPKTTDEQIARYSALCEEDDTCRKRTVDLAESMRRTAADIPDRWWFLPIDEDSVRVASFYGLHESTTESGLLSSPMTLDSWLAAANGDPSAFWLLSLVAHVAFPTTFVWGELAAFGGADDEAARRYFARPPGDSIFGEGQPATSFVWGDGRLADVWPDAPDAGRYDRVRTSHVETLLIGGALDFATPPQTATKELLPHLPNGRQVVLDGFGHSLDFWTYQRDAGTHLITTFLDSGRVDPSRYEPQRVDFTPPVTHTLLAKIVFGTLVGLALVTVLSLAAMAWRVRRRGSFGRKASAMLAWVYPVVLGLGGWSLAVLLVISTMPGTPIDDPAVAVLSVGLPIGLAILLASVQRTAAGLAAVLAGALVGTWLGFHAAADLAALFTAIAGGIAGANLAVILLDIARSPARSEVPTNAAVAHHG